MAEEAGKKSHKKLILGICSAVVVLAIIVAVVLFLVLKPGGMLGGLSDDYFVSDDTKYVLTLDQEQSSFDEGHSPYKTHIVYYYEGEKITGMSVFYEYLMEASAKSAYDSISESGEFDAKEMKLRGKYIELVMKDESFENMTTEEVRQNIEFMEMLEAMEDDDEEKIIDDEEISDEEDTETYGEDEELLEEDF